MADWRNLFDMTENAINALKKPEIEKIMEIKDKVVFGEEIGSLCSYKGINRHSKSTFTPKMKD